MDVVFIDANDICARHFGRPPRVEDLPSYVPPWVHPAVRATGCVRQRLLWQRVHKKQDNLTKPRMHTSTP